MRDYTISYADGSVGRDSGRVATFLRRTLHRLLAPSFDRVAELLRQQDQDTADLARRLDDLSRRLDDLDRRLDPLAHGLDDATRRQDQLDRQVKAATAFGWDHVALTRRLASLEDHVDELLGREQAGPTLRAAN